jgi:hypothetical protein
MEQEAECSSPHSQQPTTGPYPEHLPSQSPYDPKLYNFYSEYAVVKLQENKEGL